MEYARSAQSPVGRGLSVVLGAASVSSGSPADPSAGMEPWR